MSQRDYFSESPFRRWLGSNYPLSEQDLCRLHEFLEGPVRELTTIDSEIEVLIARREELKHGIEGHKTLAHPIRDLPNEIFQEIFTHALPATHFPTMTVSDAPLSITQVCRKWRGVALETPQLWSSLHVVPMDTDVAASEAARIHAERVQRWLSAAGTLPLSISVSSELDYAVSPLVETKLIRVLLGYSPRIRTLELATSDDLLYEFAAHPCTWPALERVVIDVDATPEGEFSATKITSKGITLWNAPHLKSVEWKSVDDVFYYIRKPAQWKNMEELVMSSPHPRFLTNWGFPSSIIRTMLRETHKLTKLIIPISMEEDETTDQDLRDTQALFRVIDETPAPLKPVASDIVLQHLRTLDVADTWRGPSDGQAITPLLFNLFTPALTSLSYTLRTPYLLVQQAPIPSLTPNQHPLVGFLRAQPQPSHITDWTMDSASICNEGFLISLRLMPNLERLWVKDKAITEEDYQRRSDLLSLLPDDDFLHEFLPPRTEGSSSSVEVLASQVPWPRLHTIRFDMGEFSVEALHAFLEVRIGLAILSQRNTPSALHDPHKTSVSTLRRFHVRSLTFRPHTTSTEELHDAVAGLRSLLCYEDPSCCSLSEECERLGVKVGFEVLSKEGRKKLGGNGVSAILKPGEPRVESVFDPKFGLGSRGDDEWAWGLWLSPTPDPMGT